MEKLPESEGPYRLLCARKKKVKVFLSPCGKHFHVKAEMKDDVHHMRLTMRVQNPSFKISDIACDMPGVPDAYCREALDCLKPFIDRRVAPGLTRGVQVPAQKGCTHLLNLFREACDNLLVSQSVIGREYYTRIFPHISEEQLYHMFLWFRPSLENSCIRYAENSAFMAKVRDVELPEGAEKFRAIAKSMNKEPLS